MSDPDKARDDIVANEKTTEFLDSLRHCQHALYWLWTQAQDEKTRRVVSAVTRWDDVDFDVLIHHVKAGHRVVGGLANELDYKLQA